FSIDLAESVSSLASATIGGSTAIYAAGAGIGVRKRVGSSWTSILAVDFIDRTIAGFTDASGSFLYASGPSPGRGLTRWNGTSWSAVLGTPGDLSVLTGFEAQPVLVRSAPFSKWVSGAWVPYPVTVDTDGAVTSVAIVEGASPAVLFAGVTRAG